MYKGSIDLCRINKFMKIKFNLIIKDENQLKSNIQSYGNKLIEVFKYNGSEYLKISPKPYITIDISATSDKNDVWNSNNQVNLNKICLFDFMRKIKLMIDAFKIPELFFIKNKKLQVNSQVSEKYTQYVRTPNKIIKLSHVVVYDTDNKELEYEGICMFVNGVDNFCCITYSELEYLYYELTRINMHELSMSMINIYMLSLVSTKMNVLEEPRTLTIEKTITEVKPIETGNPLPKIQKPNEIPEDI